MKHIIVNEDKEIIEVALNRPEQRNSFHPDLIQEITTLFKKINKRKDLRAVIFRGEGKTFCAGADLGWMKQMAQFSKAQNKKDSEKLFEMFEAIDQCPHPIIGLVQGSAFGGALGFIACCDLVIAENNAQFCFSEVKLGLVPAVISHFILKKCTLGHVLPWMMTGKVFTTQEAQSIGLVHFICEAAELGSYKNILVKQFLDAGPEAVCATKSLLKKMNGLAKPKAKSVSTTLIAERRVSKEGQEGLTSFFEKRDPSWKK